MIKKIGAVLGCLFVLGLCLIPASASSYQGTDSVNVYRQYSLIPFSSKVVSDGMRSWSSGADSIFLDLPVNVDPAVNPTFSPVESVQYGWDYAEGDAPEAVLLSTTSSTEVYPIDYTQYSAAYSFYDFKIDNRKPNSLFVQFLAENFHITTVEWLYLQTSAKLHFDAATSFAVHFDVVYYQLNEAGTELVRHTGATSLQYSTDGPGDVNYFPGVYDLFTDAIYLVNHGMIIESLSVTFDFSSYTGRFGVGMLYSPTRRSPDSYAFVPVIQEVIVEKEVIKEVKVPAEDLDLFSWIISPIAKFFDLEFFPGISIGKIFGVLFAATLATVLIKWLS